MSKQSCSVSTLIGIVLLSNYRVLDQAWRAPFIKPLAWSQWREAAYLAYQPWAARYPDHVFDAAWRSMGASHQRTPWLMSTLKRVAEEFLHPLHGDLFVRRELFGAWQQSVLSRMSGIPVQAMAWVAFGARDYLQPPHQNLNNGQRRHGEASWAARTPSLLRPYDNTVDDYVFQEGLHETHLHLNGSTHAESCWLRALSAPKAETKDFIQKWTRGSNTRQVRELVQLVNPGLTPTVLWHHLVVARKLREWLIAAATGGINESTSLPYDCESLLRDEVSSFAPISHDNSLDLTKETTVSDEIRWQTLLMAYLQREPSTQLERMFHCYILLQNEYYRLLVQSEEQFGFDQFQKLTLTDLREPAEKDYLLRFLAMHGRSAIRSRTGYLEGRFAPKKSLLESYKLLHAILGAYWQYICHVTGRHPSTKVAGAPLSWLLEELENFFCSPEFGQRTIHRLALVAHFIKKPWVPQAGYKAGPYRHFSLYAELRQNTNVLLSAMARWPRLNGWIRGVDGAANELDAPPEVFASCFRVCRRAGLTRRSFHAGEDFPHLLTGLRYMWDALILLDLHDGDRIGHGTAMGIDPKLWVERMPRVLTVTQGDWLLNLLAAWQLLRDVPDAQLEMGRIQRDLERIASDIFGVECGCTQLERVMALRGLNPRYVQNIVEHGHVGTDDSFNDHWYSEMLLTSEVAQNQQADLAMLWRWQSEPRLLERAYKLVEIETSYLDVRAYVLLQQALMREVAKREVVIETLPSSNVRISQYHNFGEHHSLRWMRVPGHVFEGDPEIMVSIGSDDPGIFAGDLETEFYQLYSALRNQGIGDTAALNYLSPLNERGRKYRFHHPSVG